MSLTGIFKPDPEDPGEFGIDVDLATMTMHASQSPVLIRRDPTGTWWVFVQGPPGMFHAHVIDPVTSIVEGYATPWHAALACADNDAVPWRASVEKDPVRRLALMDRMLAMISNEREGRGH